MTFDKLLQLIENKQIIDKNDLFISEKILEAERIWKTNAETLTDFLNILKTEVQLELTKENLEIRIETNNRRKKENYNNINKSLIKLIEIFDKTGFSNLKLVFEKLSSKFSLIKEEPKKLIFEEKGFPIIIVFEKYFEIKAIDYNNFRKFNYSELKEIKLVDVKNSWWFQLYFLTSIKAQLFSGSDPIDLKIKKKNGGEWQYKASNESNLKFRNIINEINKRIKIQ
ncbi:hypothetical protein [Wenyingzhuangia aestuarii]|uniref:hypothetical protein n=1 Tax=Wenyingzhuangia aestuarii TaxID=1647582 RepID=UPI00143A3241|nr:hypothetical protein [Wenyingzhuangia aestuarii]NJB84209.1 hypothetical protein [Wenyingzhuangia aestuarii]